MPFCPCPECNGERWLSNKQSLRHVRANGYPGDRSSSPEQQQDEHMDDEEFQEDVDILEKANVTIEKINRLFLGPQEDLSDEVGPPYQLSQQLNKSSILHISVFFEDVCVCVCVCRKL